VWLCSADGGDMEKIYYITAGPGLFAIGAVGLVSLLIMWGQLTESKRARKTQEDVARKRVSVEACLRFEEHVLPLMSEGAVTLAVRTWPSLNDTGDPWSGLSYGPVPEPVTGVRLTLRAMRTYAAVKHAAAVLNALEALASSIRPEIADMDLARESFGTAYVSACRQFAYPIAAGVLKAEYPATRRLYSEWAHLPSEIASREAMVKILGMETARGPR